MGFAITGSILPYLCLKLSKYTEKIYFVPFAVSICLSCVLFPNLCCFRHKKQGRIQEFWILVQTLVQKGLFKFFLAGEGN